MDYQPPSKSEQPNFPTPVDFAEAIFPTLLTGREICGQVTECMSHRDCIKEAIKTLQAYNCSACTLTSNKNISNLRREHSQFAACHNPFQRGRTVYLYCKNCLNDCDNIQDWHADVVAILTHEKKNVAGSTNHVSTVKVVAVFPHPSQCNVDPKFRRNYKFDKNNNGRGWEKFSFDLEVIIGDTYKSILSNLQCTGKDGEHCGKDTNSHVTFPI